MQIKFESGGMGWRGRLQENYTNFAEFKTYAKIYGLHTRLGFENPKAAWKANPLIEGSVNPSDFRLVRQMV